MAHVHREALLQVVVLHFERMGIISKLIQK
jgi:hypothetical protein